MPRPVATNSDSPTRSGRVARHTDGLSLEETLLEGSLASLGPLHVEEVSQLGRQERRTQFEACLERYHDLGYRSRVGQNLQDWIRSAQGRPLGCVVFGAPAWQCAVRDRWIGWTRTQRAQRLGWVLNNTRFLILPWVRVPHLASHILGRMGRRIGADWQAKYRQPLSLLETFVERQRFAGTCYRAANWIGLGQTQGRGRQGPHQPSTSIKDVSVYPLHPRFRQHLNDPHPTPSESSHPSSAHDDAQHGGAAARARP